MKEVDSKDVVEQVVELEEESKYKEKEVEVDPVVELGEESKYKENVKNENLQECLLRLKLGLEEEKDEEKLITLINEAEQQEVKASDLKATLIGKALISIRKANGDNKIGKATTKLLDKWRAQVKREIIQEEKELEIVEQENVVMVKEEQPKLFRCKTCFKEKTSNASLVRTYFMLERI